MNKNLQTIINESIKNNNGIVNIKIIYTHFNELDNGKRFRRHLRAKFAQSHDHNNQWIWNHDDKQLIEVVDYFTNLTNPIKNVPSKKSNVNVKSNVPSTIITPSIQIAPSKIILNENVPSKIIFK